MAIKPINLSNVPPSKAIKAVEEAREIANSKLSPVQQALKAREAQVAKTTGNNYFESEDFLRMKAFEIRNRIVLYKNLGMTQEYAQAQAEGAEVVKKYQTILAKAAGSQKTQSTVV